MKKEMIGMISIFLLASHTTHAMEANPPAFVEPPVNSSETEGVVVGLKTGDSAPFDGVLLSPESVATLIAEKEATAQQAELDRALALEKCQLEAKKNIDVLKIKSDTDLAALTIERDALAKNNEQLNKALKDEIANRPNPFVWSGIGAAAAVAVAVLVVFVAK